MAETNEERAKKLLQNEGEGSRSAARDYEARQREFSRTHDAQQLAEEANRDVHEHPDEYARAEKDGKERAKT